MAAAEAYISADEADLAEQFLADGHVIFPVEDRPALDRLRQSIASLAAEYLGEGSPSEAGGFLNMIHERVGPPSLNALRLAVYNGMNEEDWLRPAYFALARGALEALVGNELAMQRRINLSIQLPKDDSSLLPVHADVWSGDSPFEVVVWLPLVDCYATKSMFLLPPEANREAEARLGEFSGRSAEDLFRAIEPQVEWLDIPYGNVLLFSQNLMHGNRINQEPETRWSMNCRFKSLFSPYAEKRLGEFFEPITIRPATRLGMNYRLPGGFKE